MSNLIINERIEIPAEELKISSVRSRGPGGQNVNKVNTKVILRWNVVASESISPTVKRRLLLSLGHRVSKEGWLTITSQRYRLRSRNHKDCLSKLRVMILDAAKTLKRRKSTRPTMTSKLKRRHDKHKKSEKAASLA